MSDLLMSLPESRRKSPKKPLKTSTPAKKPKKPLSTKRKKVESPTQSWKDAHSGPLIDKKDKKAYEDRCYEKIREKGLPEFEVVKLTLINPAVCFVEVKDGRTAYINLGRPEEWLAKA